MERHNSKWGSLRMIGKKTLQGLHARFSSSQKPEVRKNALATLDALFNQVKSSQDLFFPLPDPSFPNIVIQDSDALEEVLKPYFVPFPQSTFDSHKLDLEASPRAKALEAYDEVAAFGPHHSEGGRDDQAEIFTSRALYEYEAAPRRVNPGKEPATHKTLQRLANQWVECGHTNVFERQFKSTLYYECKKHNEKWVYWSADEAYCPANPSTHVMVVVKHGVEGSDSELLRGELLTIIAAMGTRLALAESRGDVVVPVLLFSAMALKSRILHAYFDGQNLVIKKVPLLDFVANKKNAYERFLRAIANTPGGDTMSLPEALPAAQLRAPQPQASHESRSAVHTELPYPMRAKHQPKPNIEQVFAGTHQSARCSRLRS